MSLPVSIPMLISAVVLPELLLADCCSDDIFGV